MLHGTQLWKPLPHPLHIRYFWTSRSAPLVCSLPLANDVMSLLL